MEDTGKDTSHQEAVSKETTRVPEFLIDRAILYHGSGVSGISSLLPAEETTIGKGVYLTSDPASAEGYARRRAKRGENRSPIVYETEVRSLRLADLRKKDSIDRFASLLSYRLVEEIKKPGLTWYYYEAARKTIGKIRQHSFKSLKELTWNHQDIVTKVIQEEGFDGLVAIEGGEGEEIGEHNSFVVFDPSKVTVIGNFK